MKEEKNSIVNECSKRTVSKKALEKSWWNWFKYCLGVYGFERLEAPGFALSMLPLFEELYSDDEEKKVAAVKRHTKFYNTHPYLGGLINGIVASMEIEKANGADISDEMIDNLKVGMMGPVAGIGDSLFQATFYPIVLSIAIGLASVGSPLGAIFTVVVIYAVQFFVTRFTFFQGLKFGQEAFRILIGDVMDRIQNAMAILGLTVMGAITALYVNLNLTVTYKSDINEIDLQSILDGIFPNILPIALVMLGYYLLKKKHFSAIKLILTYVVLVAVLTIIGIV